ncbi:hypothetical protein D3Z50_21570 [Clostridiaceae bacterium]|nr:hypothetical protein [Clostridiaceae bacterium]
MPNPFFRFHLTMDTLDFGCILPTAGQIWGISPVRTCAHRAHQKGKYFHLSRKYFPLLKNFLM